VIYKRSEEDLRDLIPSFVALDLTSKEDGYLAEVQHLFRSRALNIISGAGHLSTDLNQTDIIEFLDPPSIVTTVDETSTRHTNLYMYSQINYLKNITVTLGGSADFFKGAFVQHDQFNPKFGLTWNLFPRTTLRASVFRALTRSLISDQTVEPTQVAGFNQFFDDVPGTKSWRYGLAIDQKFSANVYAGAELSKRDLEVPFQMITPTITEIQGADWKEYLARGYLYWTPYPWLVASVEYQFEQFDRNPEFAAGLKQVDTHRLPLGINFSHPSGLSARLKATYVNQVGSFQPKVFEPGVFISGSDQFWVVDAAIRYRLPKRWGFITVEAKNLLDEKLKFLDTDPRNPRIQPERLIFTRFTLAF